MSKLNNDKSSIRLFFAGGFGLFVFWLAGVILSLATTGFVLYTLYLLGLYLKAHT